MSELMNDDREDGFETEGGRYERRMTRYFRTVELATWRVLKNSFDLVSAGVKTENGCLLEKYHYCL